MRTVPILLCAALLCGAGLGRARSLVLNPEASTSGDDIVVELERKFSTDCVRDIEASIVHDRLVVEVTLAILEGAPECASRTVIQPLDAIRGQFAAGRHLLCMSWLDTGFVGSLPAAVVPGSRDNDFGFRRGDANFDELVNVGDAVTILNFLFLGGNLGCEEPHCLVELPPRPMWMLRPDGCVQCTPCASPPPLPEGF